MSVFFNKSDEEEGFFLSSEGSIFQSEENRWWIKLISPGWTSKGIYFSEEFLKENAHKWEAGHPAYINHPGLFDRRSPLDLVGVYKTAATYIDGPKGPGLYAEVEVGKEFGEFLAEFGEMVEVSILASGRTKKGKVEGKKGRIAVELHDVISTDFVAHGAAGGKVVSKVAPRIDMKNSEDELETQIEEKKKLLAKFKEEDSMYKEKYAKAKEAYKSLEEELKAQCKKVKTLEDELRNEAEVTEDLTQSRDDLREEVFALQADNYALKSLDKTDYSPESKKRIIETFLEMAKGVKEGEEIGLEEVLEKAIKKEQDLLAEANEENSSISNMGGSSTKSQDYKEELVNVFMEMGSSEESAKIAAEGR